MYTAAFFCAKIMSGIDTKKNLSFLMAYNSDTQIEFTIFLYKQNIIKRRYNFNKYKYYLIKYNISN